MPYTPYKQTRRARSRTYLIEVALFGRHRSSILRDLGLFSGVRHHPQRPLGVPQPRPPQQQVALVHRDIALRPTPSTLAGVVPLPICGAAGAAVDRQSPREEVDPSIGSLVLELFGKGGWGRRDDTCILAGKRSVISWWKEGGVVSHEDGAQGFSFS